MDGVARRPDHRSLDGSIASSQRGPRFDGSPVSDVGTPQLPSGHYTLEPSYHPQLGALLAASTSTQPGQGPIQGSFSAELQGLHHGTGQTPPQITYDAADLSAGVYNPDFVGNGTWTRLDEGQLRALGINPDMMNHGWPGGFRAGVFTDGQGRYVAAFAGTNDILSDWLDSNLMQGIGGTTSLQHSTAAHLAMRLKEAFGDNLMFTGHSLGGSLAGLAGAVTGNPAITFNAAGVHANTLSQYGLDPAAIRSQAQNGQIHNYTVNGEPLTSLQEDTPLSGLAPDALGTRIPMEAPARSQPRVDPWNPAENIKSLLGRLLNLHGMDSVQGALDMLRPPAGIAPTPQHPSTGSPLGGHFDASAGDDRGPGRSNYLRNLRRSFDDYIAGQGGMRDRAESGTLWPGSGVQGLGIHGLGQDVRSRGGSDRSDHGRSSGDRSDGVGSGSRGGSDGIGSGPGSGSYGSRGGGIGGDYGRDGSGSRSSPSSSGGGIGSDYGADRSRDNPGRDRGGVGGDYGRDGSGSRSDSTANPGGDRGGIGGDYGRDGSGSRGSGPGSNDAVA